MRLHEYGYLLEGIDETLVDGDEMAAAFLQIENPQAMAALEFALRRAGLNEEQIQEQKTKMASRSISLAFADWRLSVGIDDGYYD